MKILDRLHCAPDRFWLFTIAAGALIVLAAIVLPVVLRGHMPAGAGEMLSSAVTGLLLIVQKVVDAQQARRMADQLYRSAPPAEPEA
ncbi:hypothetical protein S2M10_29220 [Sphingomonas sp. S2M10]|uniref:hypothetical protein n=1 Tax=Sphingomonas sp. S2M10 TaxID=2705010 RepID=UPI00145784E3|nr:hypothetical protein [Sphingomonas sp. S2M10]NLS27920.1 hypothetical protein [Sphingomonas sp. S2M10]